jgi:hypothetical protein
LFVGYIGGKSYQEQDNGTKVCILEDNKGHTWQRAK